MAQITKKELQEQLEGSVKHHTTTRNTLDELQKELSEMLFPHSKDRWNDHKVQEWSKIKVKVAHLQGQVHGEGQMLPHIITSLREENVKLWYMLRVAMGDEKRSEPVDFAMDENRMPNPNWD